MDAASGAAGAAGAGSEEHQLEFAESGFVGGATEGRLQGAWRGERGERAARRMCSGGGGGGRDIHLRGSGPGQRAKLVFKEAPVGAACTSAEAGAACGGYEALQGWERRACCVARRRAALGATGDARSGACGASKKRTSLRAQLTRATCARSQAALGDLAAAAAAAASRRPQIRSQRRATRRAWRGAVTATHSRYGVSCHGWCTWTSRSWQPGPYLRVGIWFVGVDLDETSLRDEDSWRAPGGQGQRIHAWGLARRTTVRRFCRVGAV